MPLTNSLVEVCDYQYNKMVDNKANLGLVDVYFGDQDKIPVTPVVCIEPQIKTNILNEAGAGRLISIEFRLFFLVYYSFIQSPQDNRRGADALAEAIESVVHSDRTLGGLITHGYCTDVESGYTTKGNSLIRSNKITFVGTTARAILPS